MRILAFAFTLLLAANSVSFPLYSAAITPRQHDKSAVPSEDELVGIRERVRAAFEEGYTKAEGSAKSKRELARELLKRGTMGFEDEPHTRYGILIEARDLALKGRDLQTALDAIDRIAEGYEPVDARVLRIQALLGIAPRLQPSMLEPAGTVGLDLIEGCLALQDEGNAGLLLAALKRPINKWARHLKPRLAAADDELTELRTFLLASAVLLDKPADPEANRAVGWYYTFVRNDFERGIAKLVLGPVDDLRECAEGDAAHPLEAADRFALAELWHSWSKNQTRRARMPARRRATYWYELARPDLSELERIAVDKALEDLAEVAQLEQPGPDLQPDREPKPNRRRQSRSPGKHKRNVDRALLWLVGHQSDDGSWDCENFSGMCDEGDPCSGKGKALHRVGVSALALLALERGGHASSDKSIDIALTKGLKFLVQQQSSGTGLLGETTGHDFVYDHAIATLALAENYGRTRNEDLGQSIEKAVDYIQKARNPYGAWWYAVPPNGQSDTSVTGWMIAALAAAEEAGFEVEEAAIAGGLDWITKMTDTDTGRIGYDSRGSRSSRTPENQDFPRAGEAMTAVGLYCRFRLGQRHDDTTRQHTELILRTLPEWDPESLEIDMYYWYYATEALYLSKSKSGKSWRSWTKALEQVLLKSQIKKGHAKGSWDPLGAWGGAGGRVYSTAIAALSLSRAGK